MDSPNLKKRKSVDCIEIMDENDDEPEVKKMKSDENNLQIVSNGFENATSEPPQPDIVISDDEQDGPSAPDAGAEADVTIVDDVILFVDDLESDVSDNLKSAIPCTAQDGTRTEDESQESVLCISDDEVPESGSVNIGNSPRALLPGDLSIELVECLEVGPEPSLEAESLPTGDLTCEEVDFTQTEQPEPKVEAENLPAEAKTEDELLVDDLGGDLKAEDGEITEDTAKAGTIEEEQVAEIAPRGLEEPKYDISISFSSPAISDCYKEKFIHFLSAFVELEVTSDGLSIQAVKEEGSPAQVNGYDEADPNLTPSKKRKKRSRAKKELFTVDVTPSPSQTHKHQLQYISKFTINTEKEDEANASKPKGNTCFNCDGQHQIKDCTEPKNFEKIRNNRNKLASTRTSRYHLEAEQKYSKLKPGQISSELRSALGISQTDIPSFVYLMRTHGYPPGWIEEAKVTNSDLDLFDIDGKNVKTKRKRSGLDSSKIVDFSGFNCPPPDGVRDEYQRYNVARYSTQFNKESMLHHFYALLAKEEDDVQSVDMEIDQEEAPKSDEVGHVSPSLVDLEEQQKQLLEILNDKEVQDSCTVEIDSQVKTVKTTTFGTPILKSSTPYTQLPNPDNFSKDVSPVINFENLPNSTGKYENMVDVLGKVRTTLKKIHST